MFINQFKNLQPIAYKILSQSLEKKKLSHAYIIETNNCSYKDDFIKAFTKDIFCMDVPDEELKEKISLQIDKDEYIELKRIKTTSLEIKKEQIKKLQEEFKSKAVLGSKKVYIIEEANRFNATSANSILKFLEEPEENIIAILVVNNRYSLMETILSRCQLIVLNEEKNKNIVDLINLDKEINKEEFNENIINFIIFYENNKKNTILFEKKEFLSYFNNRDKIIKAFEYMKFFYLDVLKFKTNNKIEYFEEYKDLIYNISNNNNVNEILNKIDIIIKCIDRLNSYVNQNMLLDFFIIETCR